MKTDAKCKKRPEALTGEESPAHPEEGGMRVEGERQGRRPALRGDTPIHGPACAAPLVEKAPADSTGESPLAGEATGMQPIAAFLPTWRDPLTGKALTYDELRRALVG